VVVGVFVLSVFLWLVVGPLSTIGLLQSPSLNVPKNTAKTGNASQQEAKRLWEQAIAAKGGREKLFGVHNLVTVDIKKEGGSIIRHETLWGLPNKYWMWLDHRSSVFGLRLDIVNYETNTRYVMSESAPQPSPRPITDKRDSDVLLRNTQLIYLMESNWVQPVPLAASRGKVGKQQVDIVQTEVNGEHYCDFLLDPMTHLPIGIRFYFENGYTHKIESSLLKLSDYKLMNGLMIPQRFSATETIDWDSQTVEINVEFNDKIFETPPSISAGPEAWRKKG
jgi:hypothetical protein